MQAITSNNTESRRSKGVKWVSFILLLHQCDNSQLYKIHEFKDKFTKTGIGIEFKFLKIVGSREASKWKSVPQARSVREENIRVKFMFAISTVVAKLIVCLNSRGRGIKKKGDVYFVLIQKCCTRPKVGIWGKLVFNLSFLKLHSSQLLTQTYYSIPYTKITHS